MVVGLGLVVGVALGLIVGAVVTLESLLLTIMDTEYRSEPLSVQKVEKCLHSPLYNEMLWQIKFSSQDFMHLPSSEPRYDACINRSP